MLFCHAIYVYLQHSKIRFPRGTNVRPIVKSIPGEEKISYTGRYMVNHVTFHYNFILTLQKIIIEFTFSFFKMKRIYLFIYDINQNNENTKHRYVSLHTHSKYRISYDLRKVFKKSSLKTQWLFLNDNYSVVIQIRNRTSVFPKKP
jgi:hypothetical protein